MAMKRETTGSSKDMKDSVLTPSASVKREMPDSKEDWKDQTLKDQKRRRLD